MRRRGFCRIFFDITECLPQGYLWQKDMRTGVFSERFADIFQYHNRDYLLQIRMLFLGFISDIYSLPSVIIS